MVGLQMFTHQNPNTIWDNMSHKVEHQAPDVVLNLTDSPLSPAEMLTFLKNKPLDGLKKVYIVDGAQVVLRNY